MSVINFPFNGLLLNTSLVMLISGCAANKPIVVHAIEFFQAEDGIRDRDVTGVQTCALPI